MENNGTMISLPDEKILVLTLEILEDEPEFLFSQ